MAEDIHVEIPNRPSREWLTQEVVRLRRSISDLHFRCAQVEARATAGDAQLRREMQAQPTPQPRRTTMDPTPDWVAAINQVHIETHHETGSLQVTASNFSDIEKAGKMIKALLKADDLRALAGK